MSFHGRQGTSVGLVLALVLMLVPVGARAAAPALRIGVASFEGEGEGLSISEALADRLATRPLERLIPPDALCGAAGPSGGEMPEASQVREWAYNASVDTVIVGRVRTPEGGRGPVDVAVGVRSGHSGAPLAEYEVRLASASDLAEGTEALAAEILGGLGYEPPEAEPVTDLAAAEPGGGGKAAGSGGGLDKGLSIGELSDDEPIRIESDELEVSAIGKKRHLIFSQNVRVKQGDVRLTSNRLEAFYAEGESQPEKLIAQGRVRVVQADRVARCDRATYLRSPERITCEGHAELEQGCDIVRGQAIEFDLTSDRARVVGAASVVIRPEASESGACAGEGGR